MVVLSRATGSDVRVGCSASIDYRTGNAMAVPLVKVAPVLA
jgi:hypothetical protein